MTTSRYNPPPFTAADIHWLNNVELRLRITDPDYANPHHHQTITGQPLKQRP